MTPEQAPDDLSLATLWPVSRLRAAADVTPPGGTRGSDGTGGVRTLELRYLDDDLVVELARLASRGVHSPDAMPFDFPWTRGTPLEVARSVLAYQWGARSRLSPERWALELGVLVDGVPVGIQALQSDEFLVTGSIETGSWLGLEHQGTGIGTAMRLLALHLAFDGLGARAATTSAWEDNPASNAVTRKVGYERDGARTEVREGTAVEKLRYRLRRDTWEARPAHQRLDVSYQGLEGTREFLGVA